ncbi:MAG: hydantoinase B/oxoprolinase family protein [Rhodospirillales bacterium]|nr:hydantoinase B/oxoprolinase family protein [Rhodospirillales bacterium]
MSVDPITVELLRNRVASLMEEMDYHFYRSGYSTIVRESRDFSCVITDAQGRLVTAPWMFFHAPVYYHLIQKILSLYGIDGLSDGDIFVSNHPYEANMPHASDMGFIAPIFHGGTLVAFAGTIAHKADVGGTVPGSTYGQATEIFHEGMMLPPVRIHRAGVPDDDMMRLIAANTRAPYLVLGDISGQIGVVGIGARHVQELCGRFGADIVAESMDSMIAASGVEFRAALQGFKDGTVEAEGFLDHDGVDESRKVRIHMRITVRDGKFHFDFTGCDPQTKGPANLRIAMVEAGVYYSLIGLTNPDLRYSDAIRDLVTFEFAERSVLSAQAPAPCSSYMKTCQKLVDVILEALDPLIPGRAIAHSGGSGGSIVVAWQGGGQGNGQGDSRTTRGNQYEIFGSAYGAGENADGASGATVHLANLFAAPIEIIESEYPCRIQRFELNADSGGAGEFRGGLSFRRVYELLEPAQVVYRSDRAIVPPSGLRGGQAGGPSRFIVSPDTAEAKPMPSSFRRELPAGTVFSVQGAGGGGYGDPARRDKAALENDLAEGYVTAEGAAREYGKR